MNTFRFLALALAIAFTAERAAAVIAFNATKALDPDAANQAGGRPAVAGDGTETWVAVWSSSGGGRFSRSIDDGVTWSAPAGLSDSAQNVAVSTSGTCIAAGGFSLLRFMRSTDHCATWSAASTIYDTEGSPEAAIATDSAGNWVIVTSGYNQDIGRYEVFSSHSTDDGVTWSPAVPVSSESGGSSVDKARIVTDGNGTWMILFTGPDGSSTTVSTDVGATWSSPVNVGFYQGDLATDAAGTWMAIGRLSPNDVLAASTSTDAGATWSPPNTFYQFQKIAYGGEIRDPQVVYHAGTWQVIWTQVWETLGGSIGREGDLVGARSLDDGQTWTDAAAMNVNAANDNMTGAILGGNDDLQQFACSPAGTCLMVWDTIFLPVPETDISDVAYARSHDDCPPAPATSCHASTTPGASRIKLTNRLGGKDKLNWIWRSGEATTLAELGTPTATTDYVVCLYDDVGGTMRNVFESDAAAGGTCSGVPCWNSTSFGFLYSDQDGRNGPLRNLTLEAGGDGEARLDIRASGPALSPPVMPFALGPSAVAQVINLENGQCWESVFTDASTNTATAFKARAD